MAENDEYNPVKTVGELKKAIADLPDDMPVGKHDGCENIIYSSVNAAPKTVYLRFTHGDYESWSIYDWDSEEDEPVPSKKMLVI